MKRLIVALALLIAVAGSGFGAGTFIGTTVEIGPQPVQAGSAVALLTYHSGSIEYGRLQVSGLAGATYQVCVQYQGSSATYGCVSGTVGSSGTITYWSNGVLWGTTRTWGWTSITGTVVSGYS